MRAPATCLLPRCKRQLLLPQFSKLWAREMLGSVKLGSASCREWGRLDRPVGTLGPAGEALGRGFKEDPATSRASGFSQLVTDACPGFEVQPDSLQEKQLAAASLQGFWGSLGTERQESAI